MRVIFHVYSLLNQFNICSIIYDSFVDIINICIYKQLLLNTL